MGEFVKDMYGCTIPHVMKFAIGASFANAGVLVEAPNGDDAGVTPCSTTAAAAPRTSDSLPTAAVMYGRTSCRGRAWRSGYGPTG